MYGELASVQGVVALSPQEALDQAESFLSEQGYETVRRTDTSLLVRRRPDRTEEATSSPNLTVAAQLQPEGGVKVTMRGNDQEGVQARQAEFTRWAKSLPKKPDSASSERGVEQPPVETPNLPLPAVQQPQTVSLPKPPPPPETSAPPPPRRESTVWRGTKLAFGGCVVLPILLLIGLAGCAALIAGMGGVEESPKEEPASEVSSVTVRVSGSTGLRYSGNYGTANGGGRSVDGQLDGGYDDYQVPVKGGTFDFDMVTAFFQKMDQEGTLQIEILVNGQAVKAQQTSAQYGTVDVSYSPQTD